MADGRISADPRISGAGLALALDTGCLAIAAVLVSQGVGAALGLVAMGVAGILVGPILGWRFGADVLNHAKKGWQLSALRAVLASDLAFVVILLVAQALTVEVRDGIGGRIAYVLYAAVLDSIVVVVATLLAVIPLGMVWKTLLRTLFRPIS